MGYSLEFYSLSWETLRNELAQPSKPVVDAARREKGVGPFEPRTVESALHWRVAIDGVSRTLNSLLQGKAQEAELIGDKALAFVVMVRHMGSALGALDHASASGGEFRDVFLGRIAGHTFQEPMLGDYLTERGFYGLISLEYPSWGGLTQAETRRLVQDFRSSPVEPDPAYKVWLDELGDLLQAAVEYRNDVITLYV